MDGRNYILKIDKCNVQGTIEHINHPSNDLTFRVQGEIRGGKMVLVDIAVEDDADVNSSMWINLRSGTCLTGIWNGTDNLLRPIAAPAILTRKVMSVDELNSTIKRCEFTFGRSRRVQT